MQCPTCDYENPHAATVCVDCGVGLGHKARRKAEGHFLRDLDSARDAAHQKLRHVGVRVAPGLPSDGE